MGQVHILPPEIISKIAAGEVIERPASVIKELMENSLDAKTSSIEIHLKDAGKTLIHIKDTGGGIEPDDLEKIFLRHSTSKIETLDDLDHIQSLGFRGEALYSIGSIADVILRSKTKDHDTGWEIHLRG
ncbi:MAG TPA: DNA mismatch repair endonuclease MutL, partial [Candidatus Omnitrophota bacterium]|nr:DNA mismatch repair endonuclease MutL [Candidatus Omnitrophota bacterium]